MNFCGQGTDEIVLLLDHVAVRFEALANAGEAPRNNRDDHVLRAAVAVAQRCQDRFVNRCACGAGGLSSDKKEAGYADRQNSTRGDDHGLRLSNRAAMPGSIVVNETLVVG